MISDSGSVVSPILRLHVTVEASVKNRLSNGRQAALHLG